MMKWMSKFLAAGLLTALMIAMVQEAAAESKYATHATASAVLFGPRNGPRTIKYVAAESDKAASLVAVYARSGSPAVPTALATNGATVIAIDNSSGTWTNSDMVVYAHANGALAYTTLAGASPTNVTLTAAIAQAGAVGDRLFELSQQFRIELGATNLATGSDAVFVSPGDSPVRVLVDSTSAGWVAVTTD